MANGTISELYRKKLKKFLLIRVPKELVWTGYHYLKWHVFPLPKNFIWRVGQFAKWHAAPYCRRAVRQAYGISIYRARAVRDLYKAALIAGNNSKLSSQDLVKRNSEGVDRASDPKKPERLKLRVGNFWRYLKQSVIGPVVRATLPRPHLLRIRAAGSILMANAYQYWSSRPMPMSTFDSAGIKDRSMAAPPAVVHCGLPEVHPLAYQPHVESARVAYAFPAIEVITFSDAEVCGGSNFVFHRGRALHHGLYNFETDYTSEELHGRHAIKLTTLELKRMISRAPPLVLRHATVFTDSLSSNYAHWLTEVLPRMQALQLVGIPLSEMVVLIDAGLHRNIEESARIVMGTAVRFERLEKARIAKIHELTVVTPVGYIPFEPRPGSVGKRVQGIFHPNMFRSLRERIGKVLGTGDPTPEKIFLRRNSKYRSLLNEEELALALESDGFVQVYPERLTFSEQFHLFANAKVIVGATGAAFANIIFCRAKTAIVICISAHSGHSYGYWQSMAYASQNTVRYVLGDVVGAESHGLHADFRVDLYDLVSALTENCPKQVLI